MALLAIEHSSVGRFSLPQGATLPESITADSRSRKTAVGNARLLLLRRLNLCPPRPLCFGDPRKPGLGEFRLSEQRETRDQRNTLACRAAPRAASAFVRRFLAMRSRPQLEARKS